jgi:Ca2+-binding RTX toxin-like protein
VALGHNPLLPQPPAVLPEVARQHPQRGGGAVLVGGAGADLLIGSNGRDLLVGGFGANRQVRPAQEVLGGSTGYDLATLDAVMSGTTAGLAGSSEQDGFWASLDRGVQDRSTELSANAFAADLDVILP